MEKNMREKFYVFLDIDGTLWDMKDLHKRNKVVVELNPESIQAVYALVDSLEQKYDAELVITSRRRTDWCECLRFLQQEGFDIFKYDLHRTHLINWKKPRGVKIAEYMYNDRIGNFGDEPKLFPRLFEKHMAKKENQKMKNNFVVIDNADILMDDEVRRFINFEFSNQYMLFLRNCDGLNVSDKSFKVMKFESNMITLEEEL